MRVLDLGSGGTDTARQFFPEAEIVSVDVDPAAGADVVADVRELPADLGLFDVVLACHILEHLPRFDVLDALKHWAEYLVPGGALHVLVPDLTWAAERVIRERKIEVEVMMHLYGDGGQYGGSSQLRQHHVGFDMRLLRSVVSSAGLVVRQASVGPYLIAVHREDEEPRWVEARQIHVVGVKPTEEDVS